MKMQNIVKLTASFLLMTGSVMAQTGAKNSNTPSSKMDVVNKIVWKDFPWAVPDNNLVKPDSWGYAYYGQKNDSMTTRLDYAYEQENGALTCSFSGLDITGPQGEKYKIKIVDDEVRYYGLLNRHPDGSPYEWRSNDNSLTRPSDVEFLNNVKKSVAANKWGETAELFEQKIKDGQVVRFFTNGNISTIKNHL